LDAFLAFLNILKFSDMGWGDNLFYGLLATLQIAFGAYFLGTAIGFSGALGKINGGPVTRFLLGTYTTLVRAVPELVLILLLYYAGSALLNELLMNLGYKPIDISGLVAGIVVLGVVQGAYSTEVIRGALQAIPRGQLEAGRAFGMSRFTLFRRITIPAMIPLALPGMSNLWLIVTKDTALLAVVGFQELTLTTRVAAGTTRYYLEFFLIAAAIYLTVTLISNLGFQWLERRSTRGMTSLGH
jgi:polar amino acid transport system permease protein|tara:strand:- start:801 stop:1526 length:726 start_codon:yes stop_codon:yes gene_type:complete